MTTIIRHLFMLTFVFGLSTQILAEDIPAVNAVRQTAGWAKRWWGKRHDEKVAEAAKRGKEVKLLFIGDSITHYFDKTVWDEFYAKRGAMNIGFSGDRTEHVLWRLRNGEVKGLSPKVSVIMIGTNNTGNRHKAAHTAAGVEAIINEVKVHMPETKILLLAIFPRGSNADNPLRQVNAEINKLLKPIADKHGVTYLDINKAFLTDTGELTKDVMPDRLHPKSKGYRIWAEAMEPTLKTLMGE